MKMYVICIEKNIVPILYETKQAATSSVENLEYRGYIETDVIKRPEFKIIEVEINI